MPAPDAPFLFLSYARADREHDAHYVVESFYEDLCQELRPSLELGDRVGFLDSRDIDSGGDWSEELRQALATCRVFVPILSRKYFSREYCGQEWAYFRQRLEAAPKVRGKTPKLIQPVILVGAHRIKPVPAVVDRLMNRSDAFPKAYNEGGLRKLKLTSGASEYRAFVTAFADRLLEEVERHQLAPAGDLPEMSAMQNAFHAPGTQVIEMTSDASAALHFAQFVYVAGRRHELGSVREDVNCYGHQSGAEWQPFIPDEQQAVAVMATAVTTQEEFIYEPVALDETLIERLNEADKQHKVVVLIVDAWTIRLEPYKQLMDEVDRYSFPNTVVVVLTNPNDPETNRLEAVLKDEVIQTFRRRFASGNPDQLVIGLSSSSDFKTELARKLYAARDRVRQQLTATRKATGDGPGSLPVIGSRAG